MNAKRFQRIAGNAIAVMVSLITCIPVYLVIVNALKTRAQASSMGIGLPTELHWENFTTVIERGKLLQSFVNSMLYSGISTAIGVLLAAMAAFVILGFALGGYAIQTFGQNPALIAAIERYIAIHNAHPKPLV